MVLVQKGLQKRYIRVDIPRLYQTTSHTICYYPFSNSYKDESGNHADPTIVGTVNFTDSYTGSPRKVASLGQDGQIILPSTFLSSSMSTFTLLVWFKCNGPYSNGYFMGIKNTIDENFNGYHSGQFAIAKNTGSYFDFSWGGYSIHFAFNEGIDNYTICNGGWHLLSLRCSNGVVKMGVDTNYDSYSAYSDCSIGGDGNPFILGVPRTNNYGWFGWDAGDFIFEDISWSDSDLTTYYNTMKQYYGLS